MSKKKIPPQDEQPVVEAECATTPEVIGGETQVSEKDPYPLLTERQQRFVDVYTAAGQPTYGNGTQSAIAGGYSESTARQIGSRLLANVNVSQAIAFRQRTLAERVGLRAEDVLRELMRLGYANMCDFMMVGPDGAPRIDFSRLTREQAAALQAVTLDEGRGDDGRNVKHVRIQLADKRRALVDLGRHLGLFEVRGPGNVTIVLSKIDQNFL